MDLEFGHGFLPRVGAENHLAVDRCLGPPSLWSDSLPMPWAIIDASWAEPRPEVLDSLKDHGTRLLADTGGWRYRFPATFEIPKHANTSWAPKSPVNPAAADDVAALVRRSLQAQSALGVDAYLVPNLLPISRDEDPRRVTATVVETIHAFTDVPAKPFVLTVGGHTRNLEVVRELLGELPASIAALYLQLTPIDVRTASPTKLEKVCDLFLSAEALGFAVIAGRSGALTPTLRALGVSAADAGLAAGETFDQSSEGRGKKPRADDDKPRSGGPRSRMYVDGIDRSLDADDVRRLQSAKGAAEELLTCRLPCHRFQGGDVLARAREHSLWARVDSAQRMTDLPAGLRADTARDKLMQQRSNLTRLNNALIAADQDPLDTTPLDNKVKWIERVLARSIAA